MKSINRGGSYVQDVPTDVLKPLVKAGKIRATTDFGVVAKLDTITKHAGAVDAAAQNQRSGHGRLHQSAHAGKSRSIFTRGCC